MFQHQGVPAPDQQHEQVREHPLSEGGAVDGQVGGDEGRGERHLCVGGGGAPLAAVAEGGEGRDAGVQVAGVGEARLEGTVVILCDG